MTDKLYRILKYILERKHPVTAKMVAKQFCIAQATAATHLRHLREAGYVTREQTGVHVFWHKTGLAVSDIPADKTVQEPDEAVEEIVTKEYPKAIWPANPFKTSYPNVRGYDD